jgi:predicted DNA-binding protein with PD1-like motif
MIILPKRQIDRAKWQSMFRQIDSIASYTSQRLMEDVRDSLLVRNLERGRSLLVRLDHGADVVSQISEVAANDQIQTGVFCIIGALTHAQIAFYDQESHEYHEVMVDEPVELVSCTGNISIRDGKPFVHAHVVLAGSEGELRGGHLIKGGIFAAEMYLLELLGAPLVRGPDFITGLHLWGDG